MPRAEHRWPVELDRFDVAHYLAEIRRYGRFRLPADTRKAMLALLAAVTRTASNARRPTGTSTVLGLAQALSRCETSMLTEPLPAYTIYANLPVLELCVGIAQPYGVPNVPPVDLWRPIDRIINDL